MDNHVELTCNATIENEVMIRCMVGLFIAEINPTLDELTEVKTLLSEAVINTIIHGYENKKDGLIHVILNRKGNELEILVSDNGCGIEDIKKAKEPLYTTKPELERSGMGMTIMESLSDEFEINSQLHQGTKIRMVKRFRGNK